MSRNYFFHGKGYGNIVPKTPEGQIFTMLYSLVGIPFTLLCISTVGDILARMFRTLVDVLGLGEKDPWDGSVYVPLWISVSVIVLYLCVGSALFIVATNHKWTYIEAFYFSFITLSTIGLGDYVYGDTGKTDTSYIVSVLYMLVGFALIAMCFHLMEEEVTHKLQGSSKFIKKKVLACFDRLSSAFKIKRGNKERRTKSIRR